MPGLKIPEQTEMFKGINYDVLKRIIDHGNTSFGPLILEYNNTIEAGREKIDANDFSSASKIIDFLRSEGKENEALEIAKLFKKDTRAGELDLRKEKPTKQFISHIEKSFPKENE